jgi:CubicO group peptidase (beta-lactamase class C family)
LKRTARIICLALVLLALGVGSASAAAAGGKGTVCPTGQMRVATGCATYSAVEARVTKMVRAQIGELGLRATIIRLDSGATTVLNAGFGNSMKGVPASPRMYWRIGSIAIPYLINLLLQLQDEGKLSLNDKLAKYEPDVPEASQVTLRMLASSASGYPDWVQHNEAFQKILFENPFHQWTGAELIREAFKQPLPCAPETCFHYAHTNFALLSEVISKVTRQPVGKLIDERVLGPLGLDHTQISRYPAFPGAALHAYTGERGLYEDATFWSPSWSIGEGTVMTATMGDVVRGARLIDRGALISRRANRERTEAVTAGLGPFDQSFYYALGILAANGWQFQNPFIDGYTGVAAYLPAQDLTLGIVTTQLPQSSANGVNNATEILRKLSAYLSPEHVLELRK